MKKNEFATRTIHAGQSPDPSTGAIMPPIYATSTYVQSSPGVHQGYEYSRTQNPTRMAWERCIADLESATHGFAFASGMAATGTILELINSGSHVIAMDEHSAAFIAKDTFNVIAAMTGNLARLSAGVAC